MMTFSLLVLALSGLVFSVGGQHAHCYMRITIPGMKIAALNASLVSIVNERQGFDVSTCEYAAEKAEFCGYAFKEASMSDTHFTHTTPVHHYVDDLNFMQWAQSGTAVQVQANSKSEPTSIGDYDTNFCNIFNLFRNGSIHEMNYNLQISYTDCSSSHHPNTNSNWDAAYKQCDTY